MYIPIHNRVLGFCFTVALLVAPAFAEAACPRKMPCFGDRYGAGSPDTSAGQLTPLVLQPPTSLAIGLDEVVE